MSDWEAIFQTFHEIKLHQENILLQSGRQIIPNLTTDDLLQPNDYVELEFNPHFRYEEGILSGILTAEAALKALYRDLNSN